MSKSSVNKIEQWQNIGERWLGGVAAGIVMVMMCLTSIDVVLRYVFNSPLPGVYELQEFLLVGVVFLGLAYTQSLRGHINVDLLPNRLSPPVQIKLSILAHVTSLIIFAIITWQSGIRAWTALVTGQCREGLISYPLWPAKWMLAIGTGFLCFRLALDTLLDFHRLRTISTKLPQ